MLTDNDILEITNYINNYRNKHNSPNLEHNGDISKNSNAYAQLLCKLQKYDNSISKTYGENIILYNNIENPNIINLIKETIDLWYNEYKNYNFDLAKGSSQTKHFTCLIWKNSTKYGIGYYYNENNKILTIVLNTFPIGNIYTQYKDNISNIN